VGASICSVGYVGSYDKATVQTHRKIHRTLLISNIRCRTSALCRRQTCLKSASLLRCV